MRLPCEGMGELFFPTIIGQKELQARRLCRECPAQERCLLLALVEDWACTRTGEMCSPVVAGGASRHMLTELTKKTRRGRTKAICGRSGCDSPADLILSANTNELVCYEHGDPLPWR